jgi:hypothetical protein
MVLAVVQGVTMTKKPAKYWFATIWYFLTLIGLGLYLKDWIVVFIVFSLSGALINMHEADGHEN